MAEHMIPPRTYYVVFGILLVLLVLTWGAAQIDVGAWNIVVAMAIAGVKALLIGLYFMHLRFALPLVRVVACGGLLWLSIAAILTFSDYLTRGWIELPEAEGPAPILPREVDRARFRLESAGHPVENRRPSTTNGGPKNNAKNKGKNDRR